jgi:1-acyl-sn-glycerol-3-phosphate acyltransferase
MLSRVFSYLWYSTLFWIAYLLMVFGFSFRMSGSRNVPRRGPFLIIANHQSFFDPIAVGLACAVRKVCYLARRTLFKPAWFAWLITSLEAHPIDQEGLGREGLLTVVNLLKQGKPVVIFPEGTRTEDGTLSPLKPGLLLILRKMPVPVLPVGLVGAFEALPYWKKVPRFSPLWFPAQRSAIAAAVGRPLDGRRLVDLPRDEAMAELTQALEQVIAAARRIQRKV